MPDFLEQVVDEIEALRERLGDKPLPPLTPAQIDDHLGRFAILIRTHQQNARMLPSSSVMPPPAHTPSHPPPGGTAPAAATAGSFHLTLEFSSVAAFAAFVAVLRGGPSGDPIDEAQLQQLATTLTQSSAALEQAIAAAKSPSPTQASTPPSP